MNLSPKVKGMLSAALLAVTTAGAAAACGNDVTSGIIVSKSYQAPYTYQYMQCWYYGKYGCRLYLPETATEPPHWYLALQDLKDAKHISAHEVTPQQYHSYAEGRQFP